MSNLSPQEECIQPADKWQALIDQLKTDDPNTAVDMSTDYFDVMEKALTEREKVIFVEFADGILRAQAVILYDPSYSGKTSFAGCSDFESELLKLRVGNFGSVPKNRVAVRWERLTTLCTRLGKSQSLQDQYKQKFNRNYEELYLQFQLVESKFDEAKDNMEVECLKPSDDSEWQALIDQLKTEDPNFAADMSTDYFDVMEKALTAKEKEIFFDIADGIWHAQALVVYNPTLIGIMNFAGCSAIQSVLLKLKADSLANEPVNLDVIRSKRLITFCTRLCKSKSLQDQYKEKFNSNPEEFYWKLQHIEQFQVDDIVSVLFDDEQEKNKPGLE